MHGTLRCFDTHSCPYSAADRNATTACMHHGAFTPVHDLHTLYIACELHMAATTCKHASGRNRTCPCHLPQLAWSDPQVGPPKPKHHLHLEAARCCPYSGPGETSATGRACMRVFPMQHISGIHSHGATCKESTALKECFVTSGVPCSHIYVCVPSHMFTWMIAGPMRMQY